ncbi:dephospho-CoA kinase [Herbaspirillum sp. RV1423]|uniref:dephospho-CoA kinase n=1 Tax=Herbaspirillum sp. RV1423 TaxID=1443993 RepID=UPI0004B6E2C9|nr:dephospho-CoA kinase [Herbaspirillum sp. RV1423]
MNDTFFTAASRPFSVGLTGGIGSGKTTVANLFAERGAALIDTDAIAHQLTTPGGAAIASIRAAFGDGFIDADGAMDRARMRAHVFADAGARQRLESILHPLIRSETVRAAGEAHGDYLIFVVPLLVESQQWRKRASRILVVDCTEEVQIARVMQRNGMTREQVQAIIAAQATRAERLAVADDVIENNLDTAALLPQIERLHALYLSLAKTNRAGHL